MGIPNENCGVVDSVVIDFVVVDVLMDVDVVTNTLAVVTVVSSDIRSVVCSAALAVTDVILAGDDEIRYSDIVVGLVRLIS